MLSEREIALLNTLKLKTGASGIAIQQILQRGGATMPKDYIEVMERANGGEGFVGGTGGYFDLWSMEEMFETYSANDLERFAPGLLPFASDGGGNVFAFDLHSSPITIVEVPLIGISRQDASFRANTIGELLTKMARMGNGP